FGHVSRNQVKQSGEGGGGMALAGLILGYTNIGLSAVFIVFYVLFAGLALFMAGQGVVQSPTP
ncbi:MAG TPA: DUF4190 domain-containing protein, partial [Candidatus Dormibacteraeota bacterium]|nr:DUF4190 domain-containing protein [Candidatus Dormibacteraeota bacterium]